MSTGKNLTAYSNASQFYSSHPRATLGIAHWPAFTNEPLLNYAPGSTERAQLKEACARVRSEVIEIPCVVDGKEILTGQIKEQRMPSDHSHVIARYHEATPAVIEQAIASALRAKKDWEMLPLEDRCAIFFKAADLLAHKYRMRANATTMLGSGKTVWQAEIDACCESVDFLRLNGVFARQLYEQQTLFQNGTESWNRLEYRPLEGFVYAVSPFNFTAIGTNLATQPAVLGNTVLWKPASTSILANWVIYQILLEAGLPPGVINFLPGKGSVVSEPILKHKMLAGVHFTGSTGVFADMTRTIASRLTEYHSFPRMVGETGGKNFHFVHASAKNDLDSVVANTIRAAFEYQGQKCSACSRLYVPASLWPDMKTALCTEIKRVHVGAPDDFSTFMTAVIDQASFKNIQNYIQKAVSSGGELVCGGGCDSSKGYFIQPTIIRTNDPKSVTMCEEIFGPVLTVYVYADDKFEDTLRLCDETSPYALTGAIFSSDRYALEYAASALRHCAGNLYLNDKSTGAVVGQQPFGGARQSGTNDKAGSVFCLSRWVSVRCIKEKFAPIATWTYPHMLPDK